MATDPSTHTKQVASAVQEITERAQVLVREEIELARAEVTLKAKRLARGAAIGAVAGVFALGALLLILHGFAWLLWYILPFGNDRTFFWGFFVTAAVLLIVGALAGFLAARMIKSSAPPKPEMAIEEAQRIRQTVQG